MREAKLQKAFRICFWLLLGLSSSVSADVFPGEVLDETTWEKAEGLLPGPVLEWVKRGDFMLRLGELNYDPGAFLPEFASNALETNAGKYELDANDGIINVESGKAPDSIEGLPFPRIDPADPKAAHKIMYNNHYMQYLPGNLRFPFQFMWVATSGFEREVECEWLQLPMDGHPGTKAMRNPKRIEKYSIVLVKRPYDIAGTAMMLWRYFDPDQLDMTFGYLPAIRRVRRMSPANRSDAFIGTDACMDDANGYDGKIPAFEWKLLRVQDAVLPFLSKDPVLIVQNERGEWETTKEIKSLEYGYQREGSTGASWAPANLVWTKRSAYVLEMTPKDRYYNYGAHYLWVDTELFCCNYKVIYDRSGAYWKTFYLSNTAYESADGKMRFTSIASQQMVDDRSEHSTILEDASPRNRWAFYARMNTNDFSLAGFQKYCK